MNKTNIDKYIEKEIRKNPSLKAKMKKANKEMTEEIRLDKKIKAIKTVIKLTEKGFGKDKCSGYDPECANCKAQILLGLLYWYLDLLEYQKEEDV